MLNLFLFVAKDAGYDDSADIILRSYIGVVMMVYTGRRMSQNGIFFFLGKNQTAQYIVEKSVVYSTKYSFDRDCFIMGDLALKSYTHKTIYFTYKTIYSYWSGHPSADHAKLWSPSAHTYLVYKSYSSHHFSLLTISVVSKNGGMKTRSTIINI